MEYPKIKIAAEAAIFEGIRRQVEFLSPLQGQR
jgi:hypothetical protein